MLQPPKYHIFSIEKTHLKPQMEWVIFFTIYGLFTMKIIWWEWEKKNPKYNKTKSEIKEKNSPFGCRSTPRPVYEMEADCFPVFENKPDLP